MIWCLSEMPPSDRYAPPSPSVKCCCRCDLCISGVIITAGEPRQPSVCRLPLTNWGCRSKWDDSEHNTLSKKVSTNKQFWARESEWNGLVQLGPMTFETTLTILKLCQRKTKQIFPSDVEIWDINISWSQTVARYVGTEDVWATLQTESITKSFIYRSRFHCMRSKTLSGPSK